MTEKQSHEELNELIHTKAVESEKTVLPPMSSLDAAVIETTGDNHIAVTIDGHGTYDLKENNVIAELAVYWAAMDLYMIGASPEYVLVYYNDADMDISNYQDGVKQACDDLGILLVGGETLGFATDTTVKGSMTAFGEISPEDVVDLREIEQGQNIVQVGAFGTTLLNYASHEKNDTFVRPPSERGTFEAAEIVAKYATGMKDVAAEGAIDILQDIVLAGDVGVSVNTDDYLLFDGVEKIGNANGDETKIDVLNNIDSHTFYAIVSDDKLDEMCQELNNTIVEYSVVGETTAGNSIVVNGQEYTTVSSSNFVE